MSALRERSSARRGWTVEVDLDGAPWRTLPTDVVVRAGLAVGRELDRPLARALARELRRSNAMRVASSALRSRDHTASALEQRLEARSVPRAARAAALETLARAGAVDDVRFAAGRADALARRGYGDAAIRADLERQGVEPREVVAALEGLEPERERLARLVAKRGRTAAAARYLAARGFDPDAVAEAVGAVVAGDD